MTPDFPYFVTLEATIQFGHTLPGIFLFDLPVGLIAWYFFQVACKAPLVSLMPAGIRQRLPKEALTPFPLWSLRNLLLVCFSIILGAGTHLLWDGFTHEHGWLLHYLPGLRNAPMPGLPPLYKILQHLSTLIGLSALWVSGAQWLRQKPRIMDDGETSLQRRSAIWAAMQILSIGGE